MAAAVQARRSPPPASLYINGEEALPSPQSQAFTDRGTPQPYKSMGGSQSSVSFCGLFNASSKKKKKNYGSGSESEYEGDECAQRKVWPSDEFEEEDAGRSGWWVGEVDVDSKASAFIAKFHQTRITLMDQIEASQTI